MNNMYLGIGIVVVLCAIMLAIGFLVSKRNKTTADYYVGSRSIGSLVTICTACATFVGGGMTLGWIGNGAIRGISSIWYGLPQALGFIFIAKTMTKPLRKAGTNFLSLPDWFESLYHNKALNIVIAIVCLVVPITWVTAQTTAAARMLEGIGVPYLVGVCVIGGVVLLYSTFGGYLAVVYTDTVQWLCLLAIYFCTIPFAFIHAGGVSATWQGLPDTMRNLFVVPNMPKATPFLWLINGIVAGMGLQTTFQRIYSAKTDRIANQGLYWSAGATAFFSILAALVGMCVFKLGVPADIGSDSVWPWYLSNYMPSWVTVLYTVLIMMATMSTADSMLNSISLSVAHDIYHRYINPKADDKKVLKVGIIVSGLFGIVALYWATAGAWMLKIFGYSYTLGAGPLAGATITAALLRKKGNSKALIAGVILGAIVGFISTQVPALKDVPAGGTVFSFGASILISMLGSALFKADNGPDEDLVAADAKQA